MSLQAFDYISSNFIAHCQDVCDLKL